MRWLRPPAQGFHALRAAARTAVAAGRGALQRRRPGGGGSPAGRVADAQSCACTARAARRSPAHSAQTLCAPGGRGTPDACPAHSARCAAAPSRSRFGSSTKQAAASPPFSPPLRWWLLRSRRGWGAQRRTPLSWSARRVRELARAPATKPGSPPDAPGFAAARSDVRGGDQGVLPRPRGQHRRYWQRRRPCNHRRGALSVARPDVRGRAHAWRPALLLSGAYTRCWPCSVAAANGACAALVCRASSRRLQTCSALV